MKTDSSRLPLVHMTRLKVIRISTYIGRYLGSVPGRCMPLHRCPSTSQTPQRRRRGFVSQQHHKTDDAPSSLSSECVGGSLSIKNQIHKIPCFIRLHSPAFACPHLPTRTFVVLVNDARLCLGPHALAGPAPCRQAHAQAGMYQLAATSERLQSYCHNVLNIHIPRPGRRRNAHLAPIYLNLLLLQTIASLRRPFDPAQAVQFASSFRHSGLSFILISVVTHFYPRCLAARHQAGPERIFPKWMYLTFRGPPVSVPAIRHPKLPNQGL